MIKVLLDMEMPYSCYNCLFSDLDKSLCLFSSDVISEITIDAYCKYVRHMDCPLSEEEKES
jgi:hypothetical protein